MTGSTVASGRGRYGLSTVELLCCSDDERSAPRGVAGRRQMDLYSSVPIVATETPIDH